MNSKLDFGDYAMELAMAAFDLHEFCLTNDGAGYTSSKENLQRQFNVLKAKDMKQVMKDELKVEIALPAAQSVIDTNPVEKARAIALFFC